MKSKATATDQNGLTTNKMSGGERRFFTTQLYRCHKGLLCGKFSSWRMMEEESISQPSFCECFCWKYFCGCNIFIGIGLLFSLIFVIFLYPIGLILAALTPGSLSLFPSLTLPSLYSLFFTGIRCGHLIPHLLSLS
jgi:hypothetical protein